MSCFVVNKASFAKAAGIVAGIADSANQGNRDRFWLYDMKKGRNMTGTDYLDNFFKVYEMNLKSVSESWREQLQADDGQYETDFRKGMQLGKKAYLHRWENAGYMRTIQELRFFFQGVRYQIDNPEFERKVSSFLNAVTVKLFEQIDPESEHDSWGELELETIESIITESETMVKLHVQRALGINPA